MTDTRKDFEKWWNIEKKNPIPDYGQESLTYDIAFHGWQACQSLNDKRIQQLLAVIAKKDEAFRLIESSSMQIEVERSSISKCAANALAIKPENVELVEVGTVDSQSTYLDEVLFSPDANTSRVEVGTKLYALQKKGN